LPQLIDFFINFWDQFSILDFSTHPYPKDNYPLSKIDKLVDAMVGHTMLSLMDAFSGCHQIPLHHGD